MSVGNGLQRSDATTGNVQGRSRSSTFIPTDGPKNRRKRMMYHDLYYVLREHGSRDAMLPGNMTALTKSGNILSVFACALDQSRLRNSDRDITIWFCISQVFGLVKSSANQIAHLFVQLEEEETPGTVRLSKFLPLMTQVLLERRFIIISALCHLHCRVARTGVYQYMVIFEISDRISRVNYLGIYTQ